jgi:hypothetical protein
MKTRTATVDMFRRITTTALLLILALANRAEAETTVTVEPSTLGGWLVSAGNLSGVTEGEIRLEYVTDGPALTPSVQTLAVNAQASLQPTSDSSGSVIIRLAGPRQSNGYVFLARINVVDQNGNPGRIVPPYYASFSRKNSGSENARMEISNPTPVDRKPDATLTPEEKRKAALAETIRKRQQEEAAGAAAEPAGDAPVRGAVETGSSERPTETVVLVASSAQPQGALPSKPASPVFRRVSGVLDRFRAYAGEWNREARERLFSAAVTPEFRQEPAVMIADGTSEVLVSVRPVASGDAITCLVIKGGQVTSVQQGATGEWLLNILPRKGTMALTVTVQTDREITEYPLTVAPPMELFDATAAATGLAEFVRTANRLVRPTSVK